MAALMDAHKKEERKIHYGSKTFKKTRKVNQLNRSLKTRE